MHWSDEYQVIDVVNPDGQISDEARRWTSIWA